MKHPVEAIKTRVNLDLTDADMQVLTELQHKLHAETRVETIRRATRMCLAMLTIEKGDTRYPINLIIT